RPAPPSLPRRTSLQPPSPAFSGGSGLAPLRYQSNERAQLRADFLELPESPWLLVAWPSGRFSPLRSVGSSPRSWRKPPRRSRSRGRLSRQSAPFLQCRMHLPPTFRQISLPGVSLSSFRACHLVE